MPAGPLVSVLILSSGDRDPHRVLFLGAAMRLDVDLDLGAQHLSGPVGTQLEVNELLMGLRSGRVRS